MDETLLQMVEQMGGSDMSEMQKNFAAVEECGGMRKIYCKKKSVWTFLIKLGGMDECDSAAMMYQCGQEKAPNLVANAISSVEFNRSAASQAQNLIMFKIIFMSNLGQSTTTTYKACLFKLWMHFGC